MQHGERYREKTSMNHVAEDGYRIRCQVTLCYNGRGKEGCVFVCEWKKYRQMCCFNESVVAWWRHSVDSQSQRDQL